MLINSVTSVLTSILDWRLIGVRIVNCKTRVINVNSDDDDKKNNNNKKKRNKNNNNIFMFLVT